MRPSRKNGFMIRIFLVSSGRSDGHQPTEHFQLSKNWDCNRSNGRLLCWSHTRHETAFLVKLVVYRLQRRPPIGSVEDGARPYQVYCINRSNGRAPFMLITQTPYDKVHFVESFVYMYHLYRVTRFQANMAQTNKTINARFQPHVRQSMPSYRLWSWFWGTRPWNVSRWSLFAQKRTAFRTCVRIWELYRSVQSSI